MDPKNEHSKDKLSDNSEIEKTFEKQEKEKTRIKLKDIGLITAFLLAIFSIVVQFTGTATSITNFFTSIVKLEADEVQLVVNVLNIIVSLFAMIFFYRLYKRISGFFVGIKKTQIPKYEEITDYKEELENKLIDNPKRVKNLEKQYILFITLFAFSLVLVYFAIIAQSSYVALSITPPEPTNIPGYEPIKVRELTPFDAFTNILNFSGALFIFLTFKVLHDDTLETDNTSWKQFWVFPVLFAVFYTISISLLYLVYYYVSFTEKSITIFLNVTDLFAGLSNGIAMTLLFGRYVSIEQSVKRTEKFKVELKTFIKIFPYQKFISFVIVWILPFYALSQLLFGSLTIEAFGKAKVLQNWVYISCLIGKFFFFLITYLLIKEKLLNLYLHGVVAQVGDFNALEKCLDFKGTEILLPPAKDFFEDKLLNELSDNEILALTKSEISSDEQERLSELLYKNREVGLSETERRELDQLIEMSERNTLRKSEALRIAVERNLITPLSDDAKKNI